jgi:YebC/PmpR family DNA-binding regulatory protein
MSGHSKWATTKHKKAIIDSKRAKIFTKLLKEVTVAARLGDPNPDFNPRLRTAVIAAKMASMPKDNIANAIKKGAGAGTGENWEEIKYEGYGANGVAIIVEALTDNKNRSASNVRSIFTKHGGNMGESGSVSYLFNKVGLIVFDGKVATADEMFESIINVGGENVESSSDYHEIITTIENFISVRDELMKKYGEPVEAKLTWIAENIITIDDLEKAQGVSKLIEALEYDDDVQNVYYNFEIADSIVDKI